MIRRLEDMPAGVLGFEATGRLTAEDYTDVLSPALDEVAKTPGGGGVRVLLVLGEEFRGPEPGAVWQDLKLGVRDWRAWERIALVTDHAWMRDALGLLAWAMPGEVKAFGTGEREQAVAWAAHD